MKLFNLKMDVTEANKTIENMKIIIEKVSFIILN
jgi:hypothetical protein